MVLLATLITPIGEPGNGLFEDIIVYLPTLIFIEFMKYLDDTGVSVVQVLNLHDLSEDPSPFGVVAVHEHILPYLLLFNVGLVVEVLMDELTHVCLQLINVQLISLSHLQTGQSGITLCCMVIFHYVVTVYFR